MKTKIVLIAVAAICLALSPTGKAQAQLEYTPVPVVIANVCSADFTDTETQPHILVAINVVSTASVSGTTGGGDNSSGPVLIQPGSPALIGPPTITAHTVFFPSGDSMQVDVGMVMQVAVTSTTELALQPADDGVMFPPPAP